MVPEPTILVPSGLRAAQDRMRASLPNETGGLLLASQSFLLFTRPTPGSRGGPNWWELQFGREEVVSFERELGGRFVGTWHSHPSGKLTPSRDDLGNAVSRHRQWGDWRRDALLAIMAPDGSVMLWRVPSGGEVRPVAVYGPEAGS